MPAKGSSGDKQSGKKPSKRIAANGFRLPDPIAPGEILTDMTDKQWRIGKSIGVGGFGEIYLASDDIGTSTDSINADYCVKVEPHNNGPLFTEMHCYMRVAKPADIDGWKEEHNKPRLGMPRYMGSGSHTYSNNKYRFMVMERFGSDLQKIFEKNNKKFSLKTTYQLGIQIIDVLEYVHSKEYIHADIKASNLLLGHQPGTEDQVFLVDYGLACRYANDGRHKEYRYDARKAHDGTMEFTSRDAHIGAHSRRGDLEILGFNMVQWLCHQLPWEDNLADSDYVATMKRGYMEDIPLFMDKCFGNDIPTGLQEYLEYVKHLSFDEQPNYNKMRKLLQKSLAKHGYFDDGHIDFSESSPKPERKVRPRYNKVKTRRGCKRFEGEENIPEQEEIAPKKITRRSSQMSPCRTRNRVMTRTLSQFEETPVKEISLSNTGMSPFPNLEDEDEMIYKEQQRIEQRRRSHPAKIEFRRDTSLDNPTPQMIELMNKIREKSSSPSVCQKRHRHNSSCNNKGGMSPSLLEGSTPFTPEMEAIMRRRAQRPSSYFDTPDTPSCSGSDSPSHSSSQSSMFDSESEYSNDSADITMFSSLDQSPPAIRAIIRQTPPHIRTFFASVPSETYMNESHELRNLSTPSPTEEMDNPQGPDAHLNHMSAYQEGMYTYPSPPQETEYETMYPTIPENEAINKKSSSSRSNQNLPSTGVRRNVGQRELAQILSTAENLEVRHISPRKNPRVRVTRSIYKHAARELLSH